MTMPAIKTSLLLILLSLSITTISAQIPRADDSRSEDKCLKVLDCILNSENSQACPTLPLPANSTVSLPFRSPFFDLKQIRKSVWFYRTPSSYNSLMILEDRRLVLIDFLDVPSGVSNSSTVITAIQTVLNGTVPDRVDMVYSHEHYDHIGAATLVYNFIKESFPKASVHIWGTWETFKLIRESDSERAPLPNIIVGARGAVLKLSSSLRIEMKVVGGHTIADMLLYIPPTNSEQGIVMYIDTVFPGFVPPYDLAMSENIRRFIQVQKALLRLDFGMLISGHIRIGSKVDVRENLMYVEDLLQAAQASITSTTIEGLDNAGFGKTFNPTANEFGNVWFSFDVLRKVRSEFCFKIMVRKWGCRLGGTDIMTRGHCFAAVNYITLET